MEDYPYLFGPDKTVTFLTNTNWKFTTDANYADVIGSSGDIVAGVTQTSEGSSDSPAEESVTFTESSTVIAPGLKSTIVTFHTVTPGGVINDEKSIEFRRDVPPILEVSSTPESGSQIPAAATTVTLDVVANLPWWRQLDNGSKTNNSTYPTDSEFTVNIPARSTTVAASWNNATTVTVRAGYDKFNEIPALAPSKEFTFDRPKYTLSAAEITPTTVPSIKGTVNVDFASSAASYQVVWKNAAGTTTYGQTVTVSGDGVKSVAYPLYSINATGSELDRELYLYNSVTGTKILDEPITQQHPTFTAIAAYFTKTGSTVVPNYPNTCSTGYSQLASNQYDGLDMRRFGLDASAFTFNATLDSYTISGNIVDISYHGYIMDPNTLKLKPTGTVTATTDNFPFQLICVRDE
jgi:hypothetical protein